MWLFLIAKGGNKMTSVCAHNVLWAHVMSFNLLEVLPASLLLLHPLHLCHLPCQPLKEGGGSMCVSGHRHWSLLLNSGMPRAVVAVQHRGTRVCTWLVPPRRRDEELFSHACPIGDVFVPKQAKSKPASVHDCLLNIAIIRREVGLIGLREVSRDFDLGTSL